MSSLLTRCGTCNATFESIEAVQKHYNSDYHLHNVRLRVEGARALTAQEFRHYSAAHNTDDDGSPSFVCKLCKKTFHSVQTLQSHVRSTAHLIKKEERILARDSDAASALTTTSLGSAAIGLHRRHNAKHLKPPSRPGTAQSKKVNLDEREEDVSELRCLFCGFLSDDVQSNLHHLASAHEFSIPLEHKCKDPAGMLAYLARKVNGLLCLVCGTNTRAFDSLEALRAHMREKNHERVILGSEYEEFYSVSLTDADVDDRLGQEMTEVVLHNDNKAVARVVRRREAEVPRPRQRETEAHAEKRRMILAADQEALAVARKERQEVLRTQNAQAQKVLRRQEGQYQEHQLRVSLRSNKLHPKGYDGEGQVN